MMHVQSCCFANLNLLLLPFSLTSPSSLLKILKRINRNGRLCSRPEDKCLSNIFSFFTISTCLSTLFTKHVQQLKWVKDLTVFTLRALMASTLLDCNKKMVHGQVSWAVYSQMSFARVLPAMKHKNITTSCILSFFFTGFIEKSVKNDFKTSIILQCFHYTAWFTHYVSTVVIFKRHNLVSWISSKRSFDDFLKTSYL